MSLTAIITLMPRRTMLVVLNACDRWRLRGAITRKERERDARDYIRSLCIFVILNLAELYFFFLFFFAQLSAAHRA